MLVEMLTTNTVLYKITLRGNENLNSLNAWKKQQFTLWCLYETGMWEMCHKLYKQGALDEALYLGKKAYWLQLHSSPGRSEWWKNHTAMLSSEFYDEINAELEAIPLAGKKTSQCHVCISPRLVTRFEARSISLNQILP